MLRDRLSRRLAWLGILAALAAAPAGAHEDRDATLARIDAAIAASSSDPALWRERAVLERRRGNFAKAHADLGRAVELGIDPALAQRDRGLIWLEERRHAEAEASLRAAREQAPDDPPILLAHARALAGLGRWSEASDTYERLVELAPHASPDVQLERIRAIEAADGGIERALRATDAALAELGAVPALEERALDLELRGGRIGAALARLDRMASRSGARDALLLRRAGILEAAGRADEARAAYADAIAAQRARSEARRSTPAAREIESQARDGIARLAGGDAP